MYVGIRPRELEFELESTPSLKRLSALLVGAVADSCVFYVVQKL